MHRLPTPTETPEQIKRQLADVLARSVVDFPRSVVSERSRVVLQMTEQDWRELRRLAGAE